MLDQTTLKGRIIASAMKLAAEKPWKDVTLLDIAEAASIKLADVRGEFASKSEIVAAFARAVDDELLRRAPARTGATSPRDALFEVIMMPGRSIRRSSAASLNRSVGCSRPPASARTASRA